MENDSNVLKAKAMYLSAIGVLLFGIAAVIWSFNTIFSTIYFRRYIMNLSLGPISRTVSGESNPFAYNNCSTENNVSVPCSATNDVQFYRIPRNTKDQ